MIVLHFSEREEPGHNAEVPGDAQNLLSCSLAAGEVIPLGGLVGPSGNLMLLGDSFTEPLSGKTARVHGAHLRQGEVLPCGGSYQAVLEADWLVSQTCVVNALKPFKDSVLEDSCLTADRLVALKASVEDLKKSFTTMFYHALHRLQSLEKKQEIASSLRSDGGKLGRYKTTSLFSVMTPVYSWKATAMHPLPSQGSAKTRALQTSRKLFVKIAALANLMMNSARCYLEAVAEITSL